MHLTSNSQESSVTVTARFPDLREVIHTLRNRAQQESIRAESCQPGATRTRHAWRAEAFVEAAEMVERSLGLRGEK
jgi:hypothetical protein